MGLTKYEVAKSRDRRQIEDWFNDSIKTLEEDISYKGEFIKNIGPACGMDEKKVLELKEEEFKETKKDKGVTLKEYDETMIIHDLPHENYQIYMLAYLFIFILQLPKDFGVKKDFLNMIGRFLTPAVEYCTKINRACSQVDACDIYSYKLFRLLLLDMPMDENVQDTSAWACLFQKLPDIFSNYKGMIQLSEEPKANHRLWQKKNTTMKCGSDCQEQLQKLLMNYFYQMRYMDILIPCLKEIEQSSNVDVLSTKTVTNKDRIVAVSRSEFSYQQDDLDKSEKLLLYVWYMTLCEGLDLKESVVNDLNRMAEFDYTVEISDRSQEMYSLRKGSR